MLLLQFVLLFPMVVSGQVVTDWGAPGFSWTLDCESVLAGGVSR